MEFYFRLIRLNSMLPFYVFVAFFPIRYLTKKKKYFVRRNMGKRTDIKTGAESTSSMRVDRNSNIKQNYGNKGHYTHLKSRKIKKKNGKILLIVVVAFLWHYNAILRIIFFSLFLFHSFCSFHGFLFFFEA